MQRNKHRRGFLLLALLAMPIASGVTIGTPAALADPAAGNCARPYANSQGGESVRNGCGRAVKIKCYGVALWKVVGVGETVSCGKKAVESVEYVSGGEDFGGSCAA